MLRRKWKIDDCAHSPGDCNDKCLWILDTFEKEDFFSVAIFTVRNFHLSTRDLIYNSMLSLFDKTALQWGWKHTSGGQIRSLFGGGSDLGGLVAQPDQKLADRD